MVAASKTAAIVALFFSSYKRKAYLETNRKAVVWLALFAMLMTLFVPLAQPEMAVHAVIGVETTAASAICHSGSTPRPSPIKQTAKVSHDCPICQGLTALAAGYVTPPDNIVPAAPESAATPFVRVAEGLRAFVNAAAWPRGPPVLA